MFNPSKHEHRRYNPLLDEWVLVSPQRLKRPWTGNEQHPEEEEVPDFSASNPLCPGSTRGNGEINPMYTSTFVFDNDYPALTEERVPMPKGFDPLFQVSPANGCCRVMCFHPKSNVTIPLMSESEILKVVNVWISQMTDLKDKYDWVQVFENKGEIMGCSNPHPHCQIWASKFIPNVPYKKDKQQLAYYKKYKRPLLMDYLEKEINFQERIVTDNEDWVVVVPYWAVWPFETMVLPRHHVRRMYELSESQRLSLSKIIKELTTKYDNLFKVSFPYSMGWHGAPTGAYLNSDSDHWVFHGVYYPPLLRSASIKKFMVGYEMLAECQRDLTPEKAAEILRDLPTAHYKEPFDRNPLSGICLTGKP